MRINIMPVVLVALAVVQRYASESAMSNAVRKADLRSFAASFSGFKFVSVGCLTVPVMQTLTSRDHSQGAAFASGYLDKQHGILKCGCRSLGVLR